MKKYIVFIILLILSCEDIEDNSRIGFDVKVTDQNSIPLANIDVILFAQDNSTSLLPITTNNLEGVLGFGETDANGFLRLIALKPTSNNDVTIIVNPVAEDGIFENSTNEEFTTVALEINEELESNTINLPDVLLSKIANLNLTINNSSNSENRIRFSLEVCARSQRLSLINGTSVTSNFVNNQLFSQDLPFFNTLETCLNSVATFSYTLLDMDDVVVASDSIEIPINQNSVDYVFEF